MDHRHRHARRRSAEASGTCVCALWRVGGPLSAAQIMSERNAADRQTDPLTVGIICLFLFIRAGGPRLTARAAAGARPGAGVAVTRLRVRAAREAPHLMWHTARPHSPRRATGRDTTGISAIRIQTRGTAANAKSKTALISHRGPHSRWLRTPAQSPPLGRGSGAASSNTRRYLRARAPWRGAP